MRRSLVLFVSASVAAPLLGGCGGGATSSDVGGDHSTSGAAPTAVTKAHMAVHHHRRDKRRANRRHHRRRHRHHHAAVVPVPAGVPAVDMPNPSLTPGAVLTTSRARICVSGYASSVRDVSDSEKEAVYAEYGIPHVPYQHEVDHLVSLELGGSNVMSNLWPEPYAGRWGARTKDVLENRLHDLVCAGELRLAYAQHIEATNWVTAYKRYVGGTPSAPSSGSGSAGGGTGGGGTTGGGGGNCTPGYSPCLPEKGGDYDCYGGGGNGPYYTEPGVTYTVTGADPYGLDGNGDGKACG